MKALLVSIILAVSSVAVLAQEQPEADIQTTIQNQIDAFLADDVETAFTFASPNIQGIFGSSERFGSMVRNGYPMVWRPRDVQYLDLTLENGRLYQRVLIRDQAGALHLLDYEMVQRPEGWRINGVLLVREPGVGA